MRPVLLIDEGNKGAFSRNRNEVGVRNLESFAAHSSDFIRTKGNRVIKLPD